MIFLRWGLWGLGDLNTTFLGPTRVIVGVDTHRNEHALLVVAGALPLHSWGGRGLV